MQENKENNNTGFNPDEVYKDPSIKIIPNDIPEKGNPHNLGPVQNGEVIPELYRKDLKILTECMNTGEPTITLRAKDVIAIRALKTYVNECKDQGCTDDFVREVSNIFDRFAQFASENPFKMKLPD